MTPEELLKRLLYRDGLMLVIDKPAGFAVHKGPKGGTSLEDYFDALRFGLPRPPALAHRLDNGTAPRFGGPGLHLHAREIVVPLSKNREPVRVIAPVPAHMRAALSACGYADPMYNSKL